MGVYNVLFIYLVCNTRYCLEVALYFLTVPYHYFLYLI